VDASATIDVEAQVIESMGNEKYVYFELPQGGATAHTPSTEEMDAEIVAGGDQVGDLLVARLTPETAAREGKEVRLLVDASKIHLFDLETEEKFL
jgi:multiple sugar transport system ATP-binding protein